MVRSPTAGAMLCLRLHLPLNPVFPVALSEARFRNPLARILPNHQTSGDHPRPFARQFTVPTNADNLVNVLCCPFVHSWLTGSVLPGVPDPVRRHLEGGIGGGV